MNDFCEHCGMYECQCILYEAIQGEIKKLKERIETLWDMRLAELDSGDTLVVRVTSTHVNRTVELLKKLSKSAKVKMIIFPKEDVEIVGIINDSAPVSN